MSRDSYDGWDGRREAAPDGHDRRGRRGRRGTRAKEPWPPEVEDPGAGYADRGYSDPGYPDRGYPDPGYGARGQGGSEYPDAGYAGSGQHGYAEGGYAEGGYAEGGYADGGYAEGAYTDPGYAGPGYSGQHDGYGHSGEYGRPGGYPDGGYRDGSYGLGDPYAAPEPYQAGPDGYDAGARGGARTSGPYSTPDGYGGRAGYGEQDSYGGGPAGYDTGDPYASRGGRRGVDQGGYDGLAGPQYGGGYDDHDVPGAIGAEAREQYAGGDADFGRAADRGGRYGWRDSVDDTGLRRRRDPEDDFDPDSPRHNGFFRGFGAQNDAGGHRPPRRKRSRAGIAALLILILFLGGVIGGGAYAYKWYTKRHADWTGSKGTGSVVVRVSPGEFACTSSLENTLVSDGVVASGSAFCTAAKTSTSGGSALQPGYFRLHKHMGAALAWALITNPKSRVQVKVTVPDGLRVSKVIAILSAKTHISVSKFESALKDTSALGLPSWAKGNPEGFLWPATYPLQPGATALSILQTLVKQANTEYASINLAAKAKAAQFTEYQVIIEASLLEGEVPPQYYTKVARVIDNRLNQGMHLGLDSTIAYVLNKYVYNLTASDLHVNSPYNTFTHLDLPPGPINSPDLAAIQAVLHPAATSALYFVTVNKQGLTEFTSDPNQFQIWSDQAKRNGV